MCLKVREVTFQLIHIRWCKAYVYSDNVYPFGIYDDETLVGFIMMGFYEARKQYTLWKFMIDKKYQNKGFGRKALLLGVDLIVNYFNTSISANETQSNLLGRA